MSPNTKVIRGEHERAHEDIFIVWRFLSCADRGHAVQAAVSSRMRLQLGWSASTPLLFSLDSEARVKSIERMVRDTWGPIEFLERARRSNPRWS